MGTRDDEFEKADLLEFEGAEAYSNDKYDQALDAFTEAARIFDHLHSENPDEEEFKYRFASAVNHTGSVLLALGIMEQAREAFIQSMSLFAELSAEYPRRPAFGNDFAATLNNLGFVISFSDKPEGAEKFLLESLRIRNDVRSRFPDDSPAVEGWRQTAEQLVNLYDKLGKKNEAAHMRKKIKAIE